MPLAHDRSLDLLASNPVHYHCTTDASDTILAMLNDFKQAEEGQPSSKPWHIRKLAAGATVIMMLDIKD